MFGEGRVSEEQQERRRRNFHQALPERFEDESGSQRHVNTWAGLRLGDSTHPIKRRKEKESDVHASISHP